MRREKARKLMRDGGVLIANNRRYKHLRWFCMGGVYLLWNDKDSHIGRTTQFDPSRPGEGDLNSGYYIDSNVIPPIILTKAKEFIDEQELASL